MKSPTCGLCAAGAVFALIALGHLIRVLVAINVLVGGIYIRRSWSAAAFVVFAALCVWMWTLARATAKSQTETPSAKPAA